MTKVGGSVRNVMRLGTVALGAWVAACRGDAAPSTAFTVRDSAGITVVENTGPMVSGDSAWRIAESPLLTIGGLSGGPGQELFRVRGALRLDDGRIVIANAGSSELRFFDAAGRLSTTVGARGSGPGEFHTLSALLRYGPDSLVVLDGQQRRVTFLDREGAIGRTATLTLNDAGGLPFLGATFGAFGDGSFFMSTIDIFGVRPTGGATRGSEPLFHLSPTGAVLEPLGAAPGRELYIRGTQATARIFSYGSHYAVADGHYYVGTTDRYEIVRYTPRGLPDLMIRKRVEPVPVEARHRGAFMAMRTAELDAVARRAYEARYEGNDPPRTFPAFGELLTDREGNLWVGHYLTPDETDQRYSVFDPAGHWITVVDVPDDLSLMEIGTDYLLARWTDDLDVEYVRLYSLDRS